jgi:hypothetical protein
MNILSGGLLPLLVVAAFGPYILPRMGIRLEQMLIYTVFPLALGSLFLKRRTILNHTRIIWLYAVLLLIFLWMLFSTVLLPGNVISTAKLVSHLENFFQPIAIITIMAAVIEIKGRERNERLLARIIRAFMIMLAINSLVIAVSAVFDLTPLLKLFWGPGEAARGTVAERALSNARFTGIFNQPMESGLMYSFGLFIWFYLGIHRKEKMSLARFGLLIMLALGGISSGSKIFLLGGLPLFLFYVIIYRKFASIFINRRILLLEVFVAAMLIAFFVSFPGIRHLVRVLASSDVRNLLVRVTGGRFGSSDSLLTTLYTAVVSGSPITGFGVASYTVFDSAYLEYLVQGGYVALLFYLSIIATLIWQSATSRLKANRVFFFIISVFVIGAGFGAPIITMNRFTVVFWIIVVLVLYLDITAGSGSHEAVAGGTS